MKTIRKRPFQRHLLVMLSLAVLSGCSGIQPGEVYQHWEQRAYQAYNVTAPTVSNPGLLPALLRTVSVPGQHLLNHNPARQATYKKPVYRNSMHDSQPNATENLSPNELDLIEHYYGL